MSLDQIHRHELEFAMRAIVFSATVLLGLAATVIPVGAEVELPSRDGVEFQRPARGPGKGPGKGAKGEGEGEAKDEKPAEAADDSWSQPTIEKLPENDKDAEAAAKRAWESIYSPRGRGMEKFASGGTNTVEVNLSAMGMQNIKIENEVRIGWEKGKEAEMRFIEAENAQGGGMRGMMGGAQANMRQFNRVLRFVIGLGKYEEEFAGASTVYESKDEKTVLVRVWQAEETKFTSTVITITEGDVTRIRTVTDDLRLEYTKRGRDKFLTKITSKTEISTEGANMPQGMQGMGGDSDVVFTFASRSEVGSYQVVSELKTKVSMMGGMVNADLTLKLTNMKADKDVTDAMLADAKEGGAPAKKEEEKDAPIADGEAPKDADGK